MMKRYKRYLILILVLLAALLAFLCAGCDFVRYIETPDDGPAITEEVKQLQQEYVDKLYDATSAIQYRAAEQKQFDRAMQDAVNEINECRSEQELQNVYTKHWAAIEKIKTDKQYADEEQERAVNAYRSAIKAGAQQSVDRQKYGESQLTYLDSVLATFDQNLNTTTDTAKMDELLQNFYFDVHKEDEVLTLIDHADISAYEASQQQILTETLSRCTQDIRDCADEQNIGAIKAVYIFEVYRRDTVKKLNGYVDLSLYREQQADMIKTILKEHLDLAEKAQTSVQEDTIFREYQIAVSDNNIPTDKMLYAEETDALKERLQATLAEKYKLSFYRESEGLAVRELLSVFQETLKSVDKKEDVLSHYLLVVNNLDAVKTDKILKNEERESLIEELHLFLYDYICDNYEGEDKRSCLNDLETLYSTMNDRVLPESIRFEYIEFAKKYRMPFAPKEELRNYKSTVYYREEQQNDVNNIKAEYLEKINDDLAYDDALLLFDEAKQEIDKVKTNDDLWNDDVDKFRSDLRALYGDEILEEPRSLVEADNYDELADIIDYYAFYQKNATEFVCDTFRVKLNFDHNDATYERNEVYWYCELLKSAVDIQAEFERDSDYLIFYLSGYDFATESNIDIAQPNTKVLNTTQFGSDKSGFTRRASDFDDFPFYKYNKSVVVHNSQQLWYALEHEYVPICEKYSSAEAILNEAKNILREIIMEGMSYEEKIFQIYSWIGKNIRFDNNQDIYNNSPDPVNYPNKVISALRSHFLEGGIFDRLTVCIGFSKTYLLLLRMEGIVAKLNIARMPYMAGQNTITPISWSFHAFLYIELNGKWYYSDSEKAEDRGKGTNSLQFILLPKAYGKYFDERMNVDLEIGDDMLYFENFTVCGKNACAKNNEELTQLLDAIIANSITTPVSIFEGYNECYEDILKYAETNNVQFNFLNNNTINERIIVRCDQTPD